MHHFVSPHAAHNKHITSLAISPQSADNDEWTLTVKVFASSSDISANDGGSGGGDDDDDHHHQHHHHHNNNKPTTTTTTL